LPPSLHHHLNGIAGDSTGEHPALQRSTGMHGLQREKKRPLFWEELRTILHSGHGSCH
jgi:hypothetical protein